ASPDDQEHAFQMCGALDPFDPRDPEIGPRWEIGSHNAPETTSPPGHFRQCRFGSFRTEPDFGSRDYGSLVPAIGIGGRLAAPPLPHHRAYGSVRGGSIGLSLNG